MPPRRQNERSFQEMEIHEIFEEEKQDTSESFEKEIIGEPIYDEEYVGADICEVFKEDEKRDPIYDDEYVPHDIDEVFGKDEYDEPIYDEEYVPTEYGDSLEVKRSMQITTDKEESCLKHNISHTSNTSQGKVCDIIINNGSCDSVVMSNMVEKLKLSTKENPHPYNLQWINKDNEDVIKINLAPLLLKKFSEEKEEFKLVGLSLAKEPVKDKTKSCLLRPVPKPPWKNIGTNFVLGILWILQQKYYEVLTRG